MLLLLGSVPCASCPLFTAFGRLSGCGILDDWLRSWLPLSVFSAGGGRGSVGL